jgi:glycosyltransferase involved in cell wall biosynthesis
MVTRYVIITPARDEEEHVQTTIESVSGQSVRPAEWVIVDDGSTDRTGAIIDQYAAQFPWIRVIHRPNRGFRKAGGGVVDAFNEGYSSLRCNDWDFIVKLDGDLRLSPDYFQRCFEHFRKQPELGIGGGEIYHDWGNKLKLEVNPRFHVRGATKIYRRACWDAIGGLWVGPGWDTIDEVKANMLGWKTRSFEELPLVHLRPTGTADGHLRDCVKHGLVCYTCGYHPLFVLASCLYRVDRKPYGIGSLAIAWGFLKAYLTRTSRVDDKRLTRYVRLQQLRRLCGLETIWR